MKNIEEVLRCIKEGRSVIILENSKKRRALLTEKLLSSVSNRNIVFVRNILSDNIIDSISQINSVREIQTDRNNWIQDNDYDELTNDKNSLLVANFNSFKELRFLSMITEVNLVQYIYATILVSLHVLNDNVRPFPEDRSYENHLL